ncbi:DUF6580 family putative transport protein [Brevundimonas sp.]|jgi:hypothetical protein|uniref:DUF6580 family putative transport protein n=1 Tax=Brevundimonas sp. TaxID=1871086 RepID=UPI00391DBFD6
MQAPPSRLIDLRLGVLMAIIVVAALTRLIPHPPNFTPIAAIGLFGGAYLTRRWMAFAAPLGAMFVSDLVLGLHSGMWVVYGAMAVAVGLGFLLRQNRSAGRVLGATLAGTLSFFVLTNLAVWAFSGMYPRTPEGLVACYVAALPFLQNSLAGDLTFALALFGGFHLAQQHFAWLRDPVPAAA